MSLLRARRAVAVALLAPISLAAQAAGGSSLVPAGNLSAGDTAWLIVASALVLLMTIPGLALFYAGMVRKKNILATMAQSLAVCALVTLLWWALGYSLAFMPGSGPAAGLVGGLQGIFLETVRLSLPAGTVSVHGLAPTVPEAVFALYQMSFAIVTPALIAGAFAERMRFGQLLAFMALWSLLVYAPVAHAVWEPGGLFAEMGVLDFAGGTVVHVNAGIAGLVCAWMVGPRQGYGRQPMVPANLAYTMVGASLLWVGWMGFNGGSALAADGRAGLAILATQIAAAAGALAWMGVEWVIRGQPSLLGLCTGGVAGLVAITPASGFVFPGPAAAIGAIAGIACYWGATTLKRLLGADDTLDVFGVHGIGGLVGALLTGVFASPLLGGAGASLAKQALAAGATLVYGGLMTAAILWLLRGVARLRVAPAAEQEGLDLALHGERVE